jgi:hypothetical protein
LRCRLVGLVGGVALLLDGLALALTAAALLGGLFAL